MSYAVIRRTSELGIRMALGAQTADVTWMIVRQTMVIAATGAIVGIPIAIWCAKAGDVALYAALRPSTGRSANHRRDGLTACLPRGYCRLLSGPPRRSPRPNEGPKKRLAIRGALMRAVLPL
jgi:hypothetical protein